jgi:hypothetical protein
VQDLHLTRIDLVWKVRCGTRYAADVDVSSFDGRGGERVAFVAWREQNEVEFFVVRRLSRCGRRVEPNPEIVAAFATDHGVNRIGPRGIRAINVKRREPSEQAPSVTISAGPVFRNDP